MCAVKNILFCVLSNSLLLFCFNVAKKKKKKKKKRYQNKLDPDVMRSEEFSLVQMDIGLG